MPASPLIVLESNNEQSYRIFVMYNGTWEPVPSMSVMVDGAWKQVTDVSIMVSGTWEDV